MAEGEGGEAGFLRASFKVGSVHGRASYAFGERVFHRTDVPAKARRAREEVLEALSRGRPNSVGRERPEWRPETRLGRAAGRRTPMAGDSWEEKRMAREATKARTRQAKDRLRAMQRARARRQRERRAARGQPVEDEDEASDDNDGDDDGESGREGGATWNASTFFTRRAMDAVPPRPKTRAPKNYVPPARLHAEAVARQREEKRRARTAKPFETATIAHDEFHLDEGAWKDFPADVFAIQYSQRLHARDRDAIAAAVAETYTPERLAEFLAHDAEVNDDELDRKRPSLVQAERERNARRHMQGLLTHAMTQGEGKRRSVTRRKVYSHPGRFEESRVEDGVRSWSCCQSEAERSRGCQFDGSVPEV